MKTHFKVKLVGPREGFTGNLFGMFPFENGISKNKLHFIEAQRLAIEARGLHMIDDEGNDVGKVVPGAMPLAIPDQVATVTLQKDSSDNTVEIVTSGENGEQHSVVGADEIPDREALEAIADKEGIVGLRGIAEKLGVRGKSIPVLIEKILEKR